MGPENKVKLAKETFQAREKLIPGNKCQNIIMHNGFKN